MKRVLIRPCIKQQQPSHDDILQVQALEASLQDSKQTQHRQDADNQHALAGLQAQLKQAGREVEVLKSGAGHAQEKALAALKVCCVQKSFMATKANAQRGMSVVVDLYYGSHVPARCPYGP